MLPAAEAKLVGAREGGDLWALGDAQMDVAFALLRNDENGEGASASWERALSQAGEAVETFGAIPFPGGVAMAHLARATILAQMAKEEDEEANRADLVDAALTACLEAQVALEAGGVHAAQAFDIYSSVGGVLLQLRSLIDDDGFHEVLDPLIEANGAVIGRIVAEDVKLRDEGASMLLTAQLLGALAGIEEDPGEREKTRTAQGMLALQAAAWLETTSDLDLLERAHTVYRKAWHELEANGEGLPGNKGETQICRQCGQRNPANANFCLQCGTQLQGAR
jgi:hypothetical protein